MCQHVWVLAPTFFSDCLHTAAGAHWWFPVGGQRAAPARREGGGEWPGRSPADASHDGRPSPAAPGLGLGLAGGGGSEGGGATLAGTAGAPAHRVHGTASPPSPLEVGWRVGLLRPVALRPRCQNRGNAYLGAWGADLALFF